MLLAKLDLNESAELEFGVTIMGTTESAKETRLVIEGTNYSIVLKCENTADGVKVKVPKLKGILESGEYKTSLEVIVGDRLFRPLVESIEFNPLIELDITKKNKKQIKEEVKVEVKTKAISEDKKTNISELEENLRQAIQEGYDCSKVGDYFVLKKDNKYCGLVSESKTLKSEGPLDTMGELVEELMSDKYRI